MAVDSMIMFFEMEALEQEVDKDAQTLLWTTDKGKNGLRLIDEAAREEGFCYLRSLVFFCDFARLPGNVLETLITKLKTELGGFPTANEVNVELILNYFYLFGCKTWAASDLAITLLRKRVKSSKVKIQLTETSSDVTHLEPLGSRPFCECPSPVCTHGFSYEFAMVLSLKRGRKWGASNFDMGEFLTQAMRPEEEDFEEMYSQLEPDDEQISKAKEVVNGWNTCQQPSLQNTPPDESKVREMEAKMRALELELENSKRNPSHQTGKPTPLSVVSKHELAPQDSSSVVSRYGRKFMDQGTVLFPKSMHSAADRNEGGTVMTVQDDLVSGFRMNEALVRAERASVHKLTPINGLPRPFTCKRLNFLANLHTGIQRAVDRRPESLQVAIFRAMRRRPELPCDELLYQVLTCTIDRSTNTFSSNAFSLPYIEIGMHITEDSIAKTFDLLEAEFKTKWFQEMKNISVPNFHDRYSRFSKDTMQVESTSRRTKSHSEQNQEKAKKHKKGSSILGFPI